MEKGRAAAVRENHVSGIAYGVAQTAVACVVSIDIISICTYYEYSLLFIICQYSSIDFITHIQQRGGKNF